MFFGSSLKKKYIHIEDPLGGEDPMGNDRQILAQHEGDTSAGRYFCLHDRLGSVGLVIDDEGGVQNYCTYEPFGETIQSGGTLDNSFMFTRCVGNHSFEAMKSWR